MRWAAPCAAAVCLCCAAQASSIDGYTFIDPPAEFAREPERPFGITHVPAQLIDILCGVVPDRVVLACTMDDGKRPVIFIKDDLSPALEAAVLAHEKAHVKGWEHG
jgi:hypothetical protein